MARSRRKLSKELKAKVVVEALRGNRSINEIASRYEVHPNQIQTWRKQVIEGLPGLFTDRRTSEGKSEEALRSRLYEQIGKLQMELEWLKKKRRSLSPETKRSLIEWDHPELSVSAQCELLGLPRSSLYYRPSRDDAYNERLMRLLDEEYTRHPFYGGRSR